MPILRTVQLLVLTLQLAAWGVPFARGAEASAEAGHRGAPRGESKSKPDSARLPKEQATPMTTDTAFPARLTYADLVSRLTDLEGLSILPVPGEQGGQASSYDRRSTFTDGKYVHWDANTDGTGIIREEDGKEVLAEIDGPGCIWRIWSAAPGGGHIRIFLDGASSATVNLPYAGYFDRTNEPFTYPELVYRTPSGEFQGGSNCYVPIPFQKSCKIVADHGWGWFYHFNYSRFPEGTQVPTFTRKLDAAARRALKEANDFLSRGVGSDPAGKRPGQKTLKAHLTVPPSGGSAAIADLDGEGAITALKVKLPRMGREEQMEALRELVLRIHWDGEREPAVWCPLGDFFGTAPGVNPYKSLPMGMGGDEFYSYWHMPFASGAKVEVVNDGATTRSLDVSLVRAPLRHPAGWYGRFHAKWHRDTLPPAEPERAIDWTIVKTRGRGRFCGTLLNVWNPRALWWGEGDEKFFVDGEKFPSTFGTGSEDYLGYAWGQPFFFNRPFHCLTLVSPTNRFHTSGNRWHIADHVPFQESFEGCIEKYNANDVPVRYSAVGYWYLSPGGEDPFGAVPMAERTGYYDMPRVHKVEGALEAEDLPVLAKTAGWLYFQDLTFWGKDKFSNDASLGWTKAKKGDRLTLGFPVEKDGDYEVMLATIKAKEYAIIQARIDGKKAGDPLDMYNSYWVVPSGEISLGVHHLRAGQHRLTVEVTGKNAASENTMVGLDYLRLVPAGGKGRGKAGD
jgi:hypothetical protein